MLLLCLAGSFGWGAAPAALATPAPLRAGKGAAPYFFDDVTKDILRLSEQADCALELLGQSVEKRPIYMVRLGHGPAVVLVTAGVHARETANTPLLMEAVERLWRSAEPALWEEVTLLVVPLVNPDGYERCLQKGDGVTKTNRRGVDINRNFPGRYWAYKSTAKLGKADYPGKRAGSEPETRAVMEVFDRHDVFLCIDLHSRGRQLICGKPGYADEDFLPEDDPGRRNLLARRLAKTLAMRTDGLYEVVFEAALEPGQEGTLTDYAFEHGAMTLTVETLPAGTSLPVSDRLLRAEYAAFDWRNFLLTALRFAARWGA